MPPSLLDTDTVSIEQRPCGSPPSKTVPAGDADLFIASTALEHGLQLVTHHSKTEDQAHDNVT